MDSEATPKAAGIEMAATPDHAGATLSNPRSRIRKQATSRRACLDPNLPTPIHDPAYKSAVKSSEQRKTQQDDEDDDSDIMPWGFHQAQQMASADPDPPAHAPAPAKPPVCPHASTRAHTPAAAAVKDAGSEHSSASTGGKKTKSKQKESKNRKPGYCSFCEVMEAPLWRNGPANYSSLCNACGIRWKRATDKDPFSAEQYAEMQKKNTGKAQGHAHSTDDDEPPASTTRKPKSTQRPKPAAAAASPEATSDDGDAASENVAAASGRRTRKASAKALALLVDEVAQPEEHKRRRTDKSSDTHAQDVQEEASLGGTEEAVSGEGDGAVAGDGGTSSDLNSKQPAPDLDNSKANPDGTRSTGNQAVLPPDAASSSVASA